MILRPVIASYAGGQAIREFLEHQIGVDRRHAAYQNDKHPFHVGPHSLSRPIWRSRYQPPPSPIRLYLLRLLFSILFPRSRAAAGTAIPNGWFKFP